MGESPSPGQWATMLDEARRLGSPIDPISESAPLLDVRSAYAIQQAWVRRRVDAGAAVYGYKVGLTSKAMQEQLGVDQPDAGRLLDDMFVQDGRAGLDAFIQPKVEPEIAFILAAPLRGPGVSESDVAGAVGEVCGALELIDSRIRDWRITITDTVADNASSGAVVLGAMRRPLGDVDVVAETVSLFVSGTEVSRGVGVAVMGNPLAAVAWLANLLAEQGEELLPGQVVLPGSMTPAAAVAGPARFEARFGQLGTVAVDFVEGSSRRDPGSGAFQGEGSAPSC